MFRSKRLYVNIAVFGIFFFVPILPWYIPFLIAAFAAWFFKYYELVALGFLMDVAYDSSHFFSLFSHSFPLPFTVFSLILVLILPNIRSRFRS
jgi:hypothetical protein